MTRAGSQGKFLCVNLFLLRFGLVNTINNHLGLKIRDVRVRKFNLKCILIEFGIPCKYES